MIKKSLFLLLTVIVSFMTANAITINEDQARDIAASFIATRSGKSTAPRIAARGPQLNAVVAGSHASYYVFNAGQDDGYVIVAGDDRVPAILGYSDQGRFDLQDVPEAMLEWLNGYAAQIEAIVNGGAPEVRNASRAPISPMLPVRWGQGMPYNVLLPHITGSEYDHAYVGCVAVAMAQVMAYWQYPPRPTTTIPAYTSNSGKTYAVNMPSLEPMDFDWQNMKETYYTIDSTSVECDAVSHLMLYSTTAMRSNFGLTSTGALTSNIPERLITYFGYKNSAHYIYREYFSTEGWEDVIYAELAAGRPVAYAGNKQSAGHAFVCDGYDGQGRFHINWGWAGKSNGYFLLNLLNPSDEGIGSAAGAYGYVRGQGAAIGLEPDDGTDGTAAFTFDELSISSYSSTRSSASSSFSVSVSGKFVNYTNVSAQFRQGWGLYSLDGELLDVLYIRASSGAVGNGGYITVSSRSLSFGAGMTSGTYRIKPIYSLYPSEDYLPCIGSDVNYIEVTINGTYSCTIKGYGTAGSTTRYAVNECTTEGTLNHGKPVTVKLNLTNNGTSNNDMVYMFVDGEFTAMGLASIPAGESDDLVFRFTPTTAGTKTLTFSFNENGTPTLYTKSISIATMPSATLDVSYQILNITDEDNRIITADRYSIVVNVTNTGTNAYDEEFSVRLYRINNPETNVGTELLNQTQPLYLAPGESKSLQFDFDHDLIDGWRYFCYLYYYSNGGTEKMGTKWYQLNLTDMPNHRYTVTAAATPAAGGTYSVSATTVTAGDTVTVSARPNVGWKCQGVTATSNDTTVDVTSEGGSYRFAMPEGNVTVNVEFVRSTGDTFELVTSRDSIVEGGIYVIASRYYDKAMKFHENGESTFGATDVTEWLNEEKTLVRVSDATCFIQMAAVNPDTISHGGTSAARTNAFLSYGNGYLTTNSGNLIVSKTCTSQCRAGMFVSSNEYNYLVRFFNESTGASSDFMTVRYDYQNSQFRIINYSSDNQQRVWLFKLVEEEHDEPLLGDVNGDGNITVADVTKLISYVLSGNNDPSLLGTADMNGDGTLTVSDVTRLIALVLSGSNGAR